MKILRMVFLLTFLGGYVYLQTTWGKIVTSEEMTPQGKIQIWAYVNSRDELYEGDPITYDVVLNNKVILHQKDAHSLSFIWGQPLKAPSNLMLLSIDSDDPYCESFYRLLDVRKSAPLYVSPQFGNCNGANMHEEGDKIIFFFEKSYHNSEVAYSYTTKTGLQKIPFTNAMRKYPLFGASGIKI